MVKEELVAAIKNGIFRGQSIEESTQSLIRAGYNVGDVKEASESLNMGALGNMNYEVEQPKIIEEKKDSFLGKLQTRSGQLSLSAQNNMPAINTSNQIREQKELQALAPKLAQNIQSPIQNTMPKIPLPARALGSLGSSPNAYKQWPVQEITIKKKITGELIILFIMFIILVTALAGFALFGEQILKAVLNR